MNNYPVQIFDNQEIISISVLSDEIDCIKSDPFNKRIFFPHYSSCHQFM